MVRINDTFNFEVYPWDTRQTIAERLAAIMGTLPKYLYLSAGEDPDAFIEKDDVQVGDFLEYMRKQELLKLSNVLVDLDDINFFIKEPLVKKTDVVVPFIAYNSTLEKASPEEGGALLFLLTTKITDKDITSQIVQASWRDREITKRAIDREVSENKDKVKETQVLASTKGLPHTSFTRHEVTLRLEFDFRGLTLLEVFDKIKLTPRVPFASVNNLYKILRDFTPNPNWNAMEGHIYLQFLATAPSDPPEFFDAVLVVEGETGEEKGILETSPIDPKKGVTPEDFLRNLQEIFQPRLPLLVSSCSVPKEKGRFYYALGKEPIDSYVLGDLVLNDPLFRQYLAIDEHEAATKGKRSSTYIHFFGGSKEQFVKANLTVYRVRDKDEAHRKYGYPIGEYYLKVLVSDVKSKRALEDFTLIFGKLLALYYRRAPKIIEVYRALLPPRTFPPKYQPRKAPVKGKKKGIPLSKQAPDVFVAGYPTKCTHQPRIISAEEAKEEEGTVMHYPKTATEGFPQRWYVCDEDPGFSYPGLRTNDLSNNDIVPFLPCCFKTPQDLGPKGVEGKQTKIYGHYFYDLPLVARSGSKQQNLLTRDVFTNPLEYGRLPGPLQEMLDLIVYGPGWSFVRSGVFDSKTSFLECVLEALQSYSGKDPGLIEKSKRIRKLLEYGSKKVSVADAALEKVIEEGAKIDVKAQAKSNLWEAKKEERMALLNKLRIELATPDNATGCSQEMYDYSEDEILQTISDPDIYFDPRLLTNLVEKYFGCKIILFSRVIPGSQEHEYQGSLSTVMTLPRHTQAYYHTKEKVPTILLYERVGRGSEQKEYPRCELISYWNGSKSVLTLHDSDSRVSREIQILYERLRESYSLNCLISQTVLPLGELTRIGIKLTHQEIDSYGKCRALIFQYEGREGALLVTPIQPLLFPRFRGDVTPRLPPDAVQEIFKKLDVQIEAESITDLRVSAHSGKLGNVRFSIPFDHQDDDKFISDGLIDAEEDLISRDQSGSKLRSYARDKRVSRYMIEYLRWLYSTFLNDEGVEDSVESLQKFIKQQIVVDPKFEYGHIAKNFNMDSGITKGGKLYVKSDETRKRLIYTLQLYALHHAAELKQYYLRTSISNYYLNIGDFTRYRSQVLLQGDDAVSKWIRERGQDYFLHDEVVTNNRMDELREDIGDLSTKLSALPRSIKLEGTRERLTERLEDAKSEYEQLYSVTIGAPHFFQNPLVGSDRMYLYQASVGLPQALRICDTWNARRDARGVGINDARTINESKEDSVPVEDFTLYSYQSPTKVTPYVCNEGCKSGEDDGVAVLGYKDDENEPTFISLLPLGPCRR